MPTPQIWYTVEDFLRMVHNPFRARVLLPVIGALPLPSIHSSVAVPSVIVTDPVALSFSTITEPPVGIVDVLFTVYVQVDPSDLVIISPT